MFLAHRPGSCLPSLLMCCGLTHDFAGQLRDVTSTRLPPLLIVADPGFEVSQGGFLKETKNQHHDTIK